MYSGHALDVEGFITIGGYNYRFGMVCAIYGPVITDFEKKIVFVKRINTSFNSSFLDFDHA